MRYSDEIINEVREATDIVEIIGERVRLTKKGGNYFGLCPFHAEKTPSFSVNGERQFYHCFGCGEGGNVFKFLMNYENESFPEVLKTLAERAGISLPEPKEDIDYKEERSLRDSLIRVHNEAALYYHEVLKSKEGIIGLNYLLNERKLHQRTLTHFGLGMTPPERDGLYKYLKSKDISDQLINASGLVIFKEGDIRDRFFNRVMFPIMDTKSRVIGFGGRVIGSGEPKYLNSPESSIFDKSSTLYGLNFARKSAAKGLILCEGYLDTISLHEAGFTSAVAALGTALTDKHARLIKRYTDTVYLALDSDEAGVKARIRAFPILHDAGLNVKVISYKEAKDPDELIKAGGRAAFEDAVSHAENGFLYTIGALKDNYDLSDPQEKTSFYREAAKRLSVFSDDLERLNYTEATARKFFIPLNELKEMTKSTLSDNSVSYSENQAPGGTLGKQGGGVSKQEMLIASWLIERPDLIGPILNKISIDDLSDPLVKQLIDNIAKTASFDIRKFMDRYSEDDEALNKLSAIMTDCSIEGLDKAEIEKGLSEALRAIKINKLDKEFDLTNLDTAMLNRYYSERNAILKLKAVLPDETF